MTEPPHPQPPALPATGTQLPPERTEAVVTAFRRWSAGTGARLLDLDGLLGSLSNEAHRDHTLAFVLWQATDSAINAANDLQVGSADQRLAPLRRPVFGADGMQLAGNVFEACTVIGALIDATQSRIDTHSSALAATAGISADLAAAASLVKGLSMSASLHRRLLDQSVDPGVTADPVQVSSLARQASALRRELESAEQERVHMLAAHVVDRQKVTELRTLAAEATQAAAAGAEKIRGLPPRGIVAVDALGDAPDLTAMDDAPWPATRNLLAERASKLRRAETSLRQVIAANRAALAERNELRQVVDAFRAKAMAARIGEVPAVNQTYQSARQLLWTAPTDLALARAAVDAYQRVVSENTVLEKTVGPATPEVHR